MNFVKGLSKYIIIVFIGVLLAFFVARIQYDTQDLSASVLSLTEQDFFESTKWDAWYKKANWVFEIFLADQVRNSWNLNASILYSEDNIKWNVDNIKANCTVEILEQNKWNLIISIGWYENLDFSEWLFELPYSWDSKDVTLEYIKSQNHDFAIWNLDDIDPNNNTH